MIKKFVNDSCLLYEFENSKKQMGKIVSFQKKTLSMRVAFF